MLSRKLEILTVGVWYVEGSTLWYVEGSTLWYVEGSTLWYVDGSTLWANSHVNLTPLCVV